MCRHQRGDVSIPTAQQHCRASIIRLGQPEPTVFLRYLDPERADLGEAFEVLRWNLTGAIYLIGIDMFAQISFKLAQKLFASGAILGALCRIRVNSIEIVTSDKQIAGETAAIFERIARGLRQLERLALAFGHLRCVDDGSSYRLFG